MAITDFSLAGSEQATFGGDEPPSGSSNDAIERVARALYERFPHGQLVTDAQGRQALTGIAWSDLGESSRVRWLDDARAAIAAMRGS